MNCSEARHLIHLDVGDDLRADEEQQLAGHMNQCAECRAYHAGMSSAMSALMVLRGAPSATSDEGVSAESVWPTVAREIRNRRVSPAKAGKFNLQVAALSVCSLSLAVVTIVQSLSEIRSSMGSSGIVPALSVSRQMSLPHYSQYPQFRQLPEGDSQQGESGPPLAHPGNRQPQSF